MDRAILEPACNDEADADSPQVAEAEVAEAHTNKAEDDELKPKAKTIDDELDELFDEGATDGLIALFDDDLDEHFDCAIPDAAADAASRKRTIDAIMACKTFDDICLVIASGPPPKRWQAALCSDH